MSQTMEVRPPYTFVTMKEVFVFDLGGVLINLNVSRCMKAFEALMGKERMRAVLGMDHNGEGVKAVSVASKQLMVDFERGNISTEDFIEQVRTFCRSGTTNQDIMDAWMAMLGDLPEERLQFIDSLRTKGHNVYLLSNGNDLHFDYINRTYKLESHFDGLFLSQRMHMAKPEPPIFEAVQAAINKQSPITNKQSVIFIDDILANRLAAEQTVHWRTFASIDELKTSYLNN